MLNQQTHEIVLRLEGSHIDKEHLNKYTQVLVEGN